DRIRDFTKAIDLVPARAKTGAGLPELLSVLVGLTQGFMKKKLEVEQGTAEGTILEVNEEPGLGATVDAVIYNGRLKVNDEVLLAGKTGLIATRIRALLVPKAGDEIR